MQHSIPVSELGPRGPVMAHAVEACVHCGFCLSACPTYQVLEEEMDSPRGRIYLMKGALEGEVPLEGALRYVDRCLGCVACVPACPSGVPYGELLASFRAHATEQHPRSVRERFFAALVHETLPYPRRFRIAALLGRAARPLRSLLPREMATMLDLLPTSLPASPPLPALVPARGTRKVRVALLTGCVQQVLAPEINWATVRVLARNGVEVVIPPGQGCCGALALHDGEAARAMELARNNLERFPTDVDAIVTNAAGCGSGMREYPLLFEGEAERERAETFAGRVVDVSVLLDMVGIEAPDAPSRPLRLAYHDACHLANAQGVTDAPRRLLSAIPGLSLLEIPEGEMCCGSAGTYNIEQPELAQEFGARKARNILATGAEIVASGNIGCMVQVRSHLDAMGSALPVLHTIEVLDRAYAGTL